ncbi:MAG: hypothetical protein ACXWC9_04200 [Pseudobdellovibrionaceae bacterium]
MRKRISFLLVLCTSLVAQGENKEVEKFLRNFHNNPKKMMSLLPPEIKDGKVISRGYLNDEYLDETLIKDKNQVRQEVVGKSQFSFTPFSAMSPDDQPAALVDNAIVNYDIFDLDRRGLISHSLPKQLWSDSYWAIAKGLVATRYAQAGFPHSNDWPTNYAFFLANPTSMTSTSVLSPAEKYDLLVGDTSMGLTDYSWARGRIYMETEGRVPSWMGICHGWSGATHMEAKIPYGSIVLKTRTGQSIRFYQSDVKALVSVLWAEAPVPTRFLGFRCDHLPARDETGRVVDPECFDNNPASFFLTMTNQLGLNNRSVVMDATFDSEVWNFSVIKYEGIYFNPQTFQQTKNLKMAVVPVEKFTIDKFKKHRAPGTKYVVGVTMDVTHMNEANASHRIQVKPRTKTILYTYDLELDEKYQIIGGEWYTRAHPDFLWTFAKGAQATAPGDADINAADWDVTGPVPATWTAAARRSSGKGLPLYSVLKRIIEAAPSVPPDDTSGEGVEDVIDVP